MPHKRDAVSGIFAEVRHAIVFVAVEDEAVVFTDHDVLVAVVALLAAEWFGWSWGRAVAKLTASTAFVWAAIAWGAADSVYGRWLLAGLVLCWAGDALLLPEGRGRAFLLGIGAFLLGHVAYSVACIHLGFDWLWLALSGAAATTFAAIAGRWLRPHIPDDMRVAVVAYVVVIAAMLALAGAATLSGGPVLLGVGAAGFAASDLSVARERFVASGFVNGGWGLPA